MRSEKIIGSILEATHPAQILTDMMDHRTEGNNVQPEITWSVLLKEMLTAASVPDNCYC
jgi:hypothetical protein